MWKCHSILLLAMLQVVLAGNAAPASSADRDVEVAREFRSHSAFASIRASLSADYDDFVRDLVTLTEIAAPTGAEEPRAMAFAQLLASAGLEDVHRDEIGNIYGLRRGKGQGLIVVAAHLDTVFPAGAVTVSRDGDRLYAPGIGDDTLGLAVLPYYAKALDKAKIQTEADILFVGTVGEEQLGNLKGARHLIDQSRYAGRITGFVGIEPAKSGQIITTGIGSRRFDVHFKGPGGHSFSDFGTVNPAYALADFVRNFGRTILPEGSRTTFNVGTLSGGTSINAIPADVSALIDIRSNDQKAIVAVETHMRALIKQAVNDANSALSTKHGRIEAEVDLIGDRPAGNTSKKAYVVRTAVAAQIAAGVAPFLDAQSTDANAAMAAGIPAIVMGPGIKAGGAHSPKEWVALSRSSDIDTMSSTLAAIVLIARWSNQ